MAGTTADTAAGTLMRFSQAGHLIVLPAHSGLVAILLPHVHVTLAAGAAAGGAVTWAAAGAGFGFGAAGAVGAAGAASSLAAGIVRTAPQPGHFVFLPARCGPARRLRPHAQLNAIDMKEVPFGERQQVGWEIRTRTLSGNS